MDNLLNKINEPVTLKSLLENPSHLPPNLLELPLPLHHCVSGEGGPKRTDNTHRVRPLADQEISEVKNLEKLKNVEEDFVADFTAAFLGPNLWDKTYGDDDCNFNLEYMELDEFLSENGLPENSGQETPSTANKDHDSSVESPTVATYQADKTGFILHPTHQTNPNPVEVAVNFNFSNSDAVLATVPGQAVYDPRTRTFREEELKPQPMIKKSRKVYVLPDQKDDKYWDRRRKNNVAAKRSRDARRIKENQVSMRAAFLEKENGTLKNELVALKEENINLKSVIKTYEYKLCL